MSNPKIEKNIVYIGDFQLVMTENVWEMSYKIGWQKLKYRTIPFLSLSLFSIFILIVEQVIDLDFLYNLLQLEYPTISNIAAIGTIVGLGGAGYDLAEKYFIKILISEKGLEVRGKDFRWETISEIEKIVVKGKKRYLDNISVYTTMICFYVKGTNEYWEQKLKSIELSHKIDDKQLYINQLQTESMDFGNKIASKINAPCEWEGFVEK